LTKMLDENEFLSPHGIRALSKFHQQHPYVFNAGGQEHRVDYLPAESNTGMFGGNSNWRGPIWMPVNVLIIRALQNFYLYYGDDFKIECPTGSGKLMNLLDVSKEIGDRLSRILYRMLDESEFLSPHGVRALSKYHALRPFMIESNGTTHMVGYEPAESRTGAFGGNSNWRGPVWFPINYLIIEALQVYHYYYGDDFTIECPTGSGKFMNLWDVAMELERRLIGLFVRDGQGRRAVFGACERFQTDPHWRDHIPFYEYFNGDDGAGLGASHQTGWTGIVAKMIRQVAQYDGVSAKDR